jgi:putative SOS response-associated peptidase YedK
MCERYSITVDKSTIEYHFNAKFISGQQEFEPTYNAAPSQLLPIITTHNGPTSIVLAKMELRSGERPRWKNRPAK